MGWERVEEMKRRQCYVAEEYAAELRQWKGHKGSNSCLWQLPWVPPPPCLRVRRRRRWRGGRW